MTEAELYRFIADIIEDLKNTIREIVKEAADLDDSSNLIKNIDLDVIPGSNQVVLIAPAYYNYLSDGRLPGKKKVPISVLIGWIKKKKIRGRNKKGKFITTNSLAFAIQNSIFKVGIRPRNYSSSVTAAINQTFEQILDDPDFTRILFTQLEDTF